MAQLDADENFDVRVVVELRGRGHNVLRGTGRNVGQTFLSAGLQRQTGMSAPPSFRSLLRPERQAGPVEGSRTRTCWPLPFRRAGRC
jgi:hypothetical protein